MLRIILIRPGSTDYDQEGRIQGTLDIPLNERGSAEVARVIEELRHEEIDASMRRRASRPGKPPRRSPRPLACA